MLSIELAAQYEQIVYPHINQPGAHVQIKIKFIFRAYMVCSSNRVNNNQMVQQPYSYGCCCVCGILKSYSHDFTRDHIITHCALSMREISMISLIIKLCLWVNKSAMWNLSGRIKITFHCTSVNKHTHKRRVILHLII